MASKVGITQVSGKATLSYVEAEAIVSFARARGITSSRLINILTTKTNLTATDIFLIARVLDQSFTDTPTVTESDVKTIAKVLSDSITISEAALLNQALASIADSALVSESFSKVVTFSRAFTDSPSISESFVADIAGTDNSKLNNSALNTFGLNT